MELEVTSKVTGTRGTARGPRLKVDRAFLTSSQEVTASGILQINAGQPFSAGSSETNWATGAVSETQSSSETACSQVGEQKTLKGQSPFPAQALRPHGPTVAGPFLFLLFAAALSSLLCCTVLILAYSHELQRQKKGITAMMSNSSSSSSSSSLQTSAADMLPPKLAFLFLIKERLPFAPLWDRFFKGYEGQYRIYIQPTRRLPPAYINSMPPVFVHRFLTPHRANWGGIDIVAAERRLLMFALKDPANQYFILLSESCIPLWPFWYTRNYVSAMPVSYVEVYRQPHNRTFPRYIAKAFQPDVSAEQFVKGSQWFILRRHHAEMVASDRRYFNRFARSCKMLRRRRKLCCADEHYLQTFLNIADPKGISRYPTTFTDWRVRGFHPRAFGPRAVSVRLIRMIKEQHQFVTFRKSFPSVKAQYRHLLDPTVPEPPPSPENGYCAVNGRLRPCFLFARKFRSSVLPVLLNHSQSLFGF